MNERIKLLALQAGDYVNSVYTPPVRSKTPGKIWEDGHVGWHDQFHEKFAELIVRECVIQCEREWIRHGTDSIHNQAIHGCINSIKEHFGVKE